MTEAESVAYTIGWNDGFDWCSTGKPYENPFTRQSEEAIAWEEGFDEGVSSYEHF